MGLQSLLLVLSFLGYLTINSNTSGDTLKVLVESRGINPEQLSIAIDKSDYRLMVKSGIEVIKSYPVVFGGNPVDDKLMQGDQCTPEGVFKVRAIYPHKSWSKFIWIDYPNQQSWQKHQLAKRNDLIPKGADIGGEIGIHGVPERYDDVIEMKINWTLGCISLTNNDIDELYPYIFEGMEIHISK